MLNFIKKVKINAKIFAYIETLCYIYSIILNKHIINLKFTDMKKFIYIDFSKKETATLKELREIICMRRMFALKSHGHEVTVHTTDKTLQQVAAHYPSYEIRKFNYAKAIEVFNAGGYQKATLLQD